MFHLYMQQYIKNKQFYLQNHEEDYVILQDEVFLKTILYKDLAYHLKHYSKEMCLLLLEELKAL